MRIKKVQRTEMQNFVEDVDSDCHRGHMPELIETKIPDEGLAGVQVVYNGNTRTLMP